MKKPNFFIIGAPKCATTSLASWLSQHSEVFFSSRKEPHHFNSDRGDNRKPEREAYERLFAAATEAHRAVGEGSVWYLYSDIALARILEYNPAARFIVCLRNPIDMAHSLHEQLVYNRREDILDFETAWDAQFERMEGRNMPRRPEDPRQHLYAEVCSLGKHYARARAICGPDRLHPILFDDLRSDPKKEYQRLCDFLGIDSSFEPDFDVENEARQIRNGALFAAAAHLGRMKSRLGIQRNFGLHKRLIALSVNHGPRQALPPALRSRLAAHFASDVRLLGELLGRDLCGWLEAESA